jgi:hypothetical protein
VQDKFPNTVSGRKRTRGRGFRVNAVEDFHQRRAMPGFAIKGAVELIEDEGDLGHRSNLALSTKQAR